MKTKQLFTAAFAIRAHTAKAFAGAMFAAAMLFSSAAFAQVKIGDNPTVIKSTAVLEVESTSKSFYPPRVSLTSALVAAPITGLTATDKGATVYNLANAGSGATMVTEGICTWDGTKWVCVNNIEQTAKTAFSASKGNSQTIPVNTITKMTYVLENYDRGNDYNNGISTFTVSSPGIYQVTACATFDQGTVTGTTGRSVRLFKNSVQINAGLVAANMSTGLGYSACGSTNVLLNIGDYLELAAHVGNTALTISDASFEVLKVSN